MIEGSFNGTRIKNPLLAMYKALTPLISRDGDGLQHRYACCTSYSWAIPTLEFAEAIIAALSDTGIKGIVDVGAGTGYWAWYLRQFGLVDILSFDANPHYNRFANGNWSPVLAGKASVSWEHPDRALMLVWPPHGTSMALEALKFYRGNMLVYVGEGKGGCTGDKGFFKRLERDWEVYYVGDAPNWPGIHTENTVYLRAGIT